MLTAEERPSANLQDPDHMMLKPLQFKTIMYAHIKSNELIIVICLGQDYQLIMSIICIKKNIIPYYLYKTLEVYLVTTLEVYHIKH